MESNFPRPSELKHGAGVNFFKSSLVESGAEARTDFFDLPKIPFNALKGYHLWNQISLDPRELKHGAGFNIFKFPLVESGAEARTDFFDLPKIPFNALKGYHLWNQISFDPCELKLEAGFNIFKFP